MYYHSCGYFKQSFAYMQRCLDILQIVAGDYHPEIAQIYANLGLMYEEVDNHSASIDANQTSLQQLLMIYGEDSIQVAGSYQALAQSLSRQQEFRKALKC
jgi:tetratricopeptide (TPR) repeat protein